MKALSLLTGARKWFAAGLCGTAFAFGGCNFSEFTTTTTTTLNSRDVVTFLVRSWLLTPIEQAIDTGIDRLFDKLEGDEND